jgi:hypothetical protein
MGFDLGNFITNAITTAGHAIGVVPQNTTITGVDLSPQNIGKSLDAFTKTVGDAVNSIPLVGPLFHAELDLATRPFSIAEDMVKGGRIDQVLVNQFQRSIGDVKEIAPYAQTVVSLVPGIGPPVSAAIGAGLTLAQGRPLDEVAMAAIKGAVPGGPLAAAAFDLGKAAMSGQAGNIGSAAIRAIGSATGVEIPPAASSGLQAGLNAAQAVANGKKPDAALLSAAASALPGDIKSAVSSALSAGKLDDVANTLIKAGQSAIPKLTDDQSKALENALKIGMAVGHGQTLQRATTRDVSNPNVLNRIAGHGRNDNVVRAARASLHNRGIRGFNLGLGVMAHRNVNRYAVERMRAGLGTDDKHGFDVALALHIGRVAAPQPPTNTHPATAAAYAVTHGMRGSVPEHKAAMMRTVAGTPQGRAGATTAANQIAHANAHADEGFFAWIWHAFKSLIGLEERAKQAFFKAGDETFGAHQPVAPAPKK